MDQVNYWKVCWQLAGTGSPVVASKNEQEVLATSDSHTSGCPVVMVTRLQSIEPLNPVMQFDVYSSTLPVHSCRGM